MELKSPKIMGKEIIGISYGEDKVVTRFKLDDDTVISYDQVISLVGEEKTEGFRVLGNQYKKRLDFNTGYGLSSSLPVFTITNGFNSNMGKQYAEILRVIADQLESVTV